MNPIKDISSLFFPEKCAVCGDSLPEGGLFICNSCKWDMPLTGNWKLPVNPVASKLSESIPVENACSFFRFIHESAYRDLIHRFKYGGAWKMARNLGYWFGCELRDSGLYSGIDAVVPVPLHLRRRLDRGYNQSEYLADGMAKAMGTAVESKAVVRSMYNESQTKHSRTGRWENVQGIFKVRKPERLAGKHILIVDDVLTTGATLISLARTIIDAVPDCRISVAALAASRSDGY